MSTPFSPEPVNMLGFMAKGLKVANQLTLRRQESPGLARKTQCGPKGPNKRKRKADERELEKWQLGKDVNCRLWFEDGGKGSWTGRAGSLWKLGKVRKETLPLGFQKEDSPADALILAQ